ncbi:MAG TPA: hypothetical protein VKS79_12595 [Gemmataceae bacterium]|nr:hypothetical protein [Gemmataceae bacterium]
MEMPSEKRERQIGRIKQLLLRRGHPYLLMAIFLALMGLSGFLASVFMHACGLNSMAARYPLAVGVAYLVFLACLGIWLAAHRKSRGAPPPTYHPAGPNYGPYYDPYYYDLFPWFTFPRVGSGSNAGTSSASGKSGSSGGGLDLVDGDGLVLLVVILIAVAVLAALIASVYVIFIAPALLAELLVDGVFLAGLAGRLRAPNAPHWSIGAIRRTWAPVAIIAVVFLVIGIALEFFVPGAHSMGEAIRLAQLR